MTPVERIERMLNMEALQPEKDAANIYIPHGLDSAVKRKAYEECLRILKEKNVPA